LAPFARALMISGYYILDVQSTPTSEAAPQRWGKTTLDILTSAGW